MRDEGRENVKHYTIMSVKGRMAFYGDACGAVARAIRHEEQPRGVTL